MSDDIDDTDELTTGELSGSGPTESGSGGGGSTASARDATAGTDAADPPPADRANDASVSEAEDRRSRDVVRYVNYLVLAGLVVLALVSGIQFYGAVSRTISQWVTAEYRSLFHGAFNLAVLLIAAAGISWQIRRVTS